MLGCMWLFSIQCCTSRPFNLGIINLGTIKNRTHGVSRSASQCKQITAVILTGHSSGCHRHVFEAVLWTAAVCGEFQRNLILSGNWGWLAADCLPRLWFPEQGGIHLASSSWVPPFMISVQFSSTEWIFWSLRVQHYMEISQPRVPSSPQGGLFPASSCEKQPAAPSELDRIVGKCSCKEEKSGQGQDWECEIQQRCWELRTSYWKRTSHRFHHSFMGERRRQIQKDFYYHYCYFCVWERKEKSNSVVKLVNSGILLKKQSSDPFRTPVSEVRGLPLQQVRAAVRLHRKAPAAPSSLVLTGLQGFFSTLPHPLPLPQGLFTVWMITKSKQWGLTLDMEL